MTIPWQHFVTKLIFCLWGTVPEWSCLDMKIRLPVTMDEMVLFTKAVSNARENALIVADLPNKSYENEADAVANSERLIRAGADAVKLEGRLTRHHQGNHQGWNTCHGTSWAFATDGQKIYGSRKNGRGCQSAASRCQGITRSRSL